MQVSDGVGVPITVHAGYQSHLQRLVTGRSGDLVKRCQSARVTSARCLCTKGDTAGFLERLDSQQLLGVRR